MRPIPISLKKRVLNTWLDGEDYRAIRERTGVSLGKISDIIDEGRMEMPDLDELRALNRTVKENNLSVSRARKGASLVTTLQKLGIDEEDAAQAIKQITSYGEEAPKILAEAQTLLKLEETGVRYNQLASRYRRMSEDVPRLTQEREALKDEIERLEESLTNLQALQTLQNKLKQHGLTIKKMDRFIEDSLKLEEKGFTPSAAETLSTELAKHGLKPKKAAEIISEAVAEHASLEKAISKAKRELETTERKVEEDQHTRKLFEKAVESLDQQIKEKITVRDDIYRSIELKKAQMFAEVAEYRQQLRSEITALEEKKQKLQQEVKELTAERDKRQDELRSEIQALQNDRDLLQQEVTEALKKTKTEIDKLEEGIRSRKPLANLAQILSGSKLSLSKEDLELLLVLLKNFERIPASPYGPLGRKRSREAIEEAIKALGEEIWTE